MQRIGLSVQRPGLKLVILVDAESPVVVEPHVSVKGKFAAILVKGVALEVCMADSDLKTRSRGPVGVCIDLPESFVQEGNLGVDGKIKPRHRLEPDAFEYVGEGLVGRLEWRRTRDAGARRRSHLTERVIEIYVKIGIDIQPVDC